MVTDLPALDISADPFDNFLLAMARVGRADFLVSGDRAGVLAIGQFEPTRIVTTRQLIQQLGLTNQG